MAEETKNPYGYGDVEEVIKQQGGGRYLSFKKGDKGRVIQIRLTGEPKYVNQHWILDISGKQTPINCSGEVKKDGKKIYPCPYCGDNVPVKDRLQKTAKWGWVVIDREDNGIKVFTGPTQIARSIRDISELKNKITGKIIHGDPTKYDFMIERTEEPGKSYYKVDPLPDTKGDLTEEEKKKVAEAGFDLAAELKGGKSSEHIGNYGKRDMETVPGSEDINPSDIPVNLGEETETGDDLPF